MKIHQLPERLANKIAAGEVVERPASVVKELIENSIDANSTHIKVELVDAGLVQIKVTDNGSGMGEEDCKKAFLRHATSKIKYDTDLFHIKSLGFRGEALASIASVSKLTIISSLGKEAGTKLYLEAGKVVAQSKSDGRRGTVITVNELFFNTPARLKYLKTIHTELGHITDLINRYALAQPHIRFEVFHNEKNIFATTGSSNVLQVISQIYGMQVAKNMLHLKGTTTDFDIEGYIAKPEITRSSRNYITIIVNGRYIKSNVLTHAIIRAYDTLLPIHRFPLAVFFIKLDPILVDVNVHPTKLEVRFSKEKELVEVIEHMIRNKFQQSTLIPRIERKQKKIDKTEQKTFQFSLSPNNMYLHEQKNGEHPLLHSNIEADTDIPMNIDSNKHLHRKQLHTDGNNDVKDDVVENNQKERLPAMYPIGQLQGTYILAQNEIGFYMIDQHAAQERIKYEFFKQKLGQPTASLQQLLMPLTFEFTTEEVIFIEKYNDQLEQIGIYLEPFGGQTFAVRSHPTWFPKGLEEEIIRDIVEQVIQNGTIRIGKLREEVAILMACKRSIKANYYLSNVEMERLLEDLRNTNDPFTCPHGRPVIVHFTYYEIEKMFKRIM